MAVYRDTRRRGAAPLALGAVVLALLAAGLALFVALRPAAPDDQATLRADLTELLSRLDVLAVEYPQQQAGQDTGATIALRSAHTTWDRAQPRLAALDPALATSITTTLAALDQAVAANAPPATVTAQVDPLLAQLRAWLASH